MLLTYFLDAFLYFIFIDSMNTVTSKDHTNYKEVINECEENAKRGHFIFRGIRCGVAHKGGFIKSSLYSAFEGENLWENNFGPLEIESDILKDAKQHFSSESTKIEMITELRHYGEKLAIIDFTRSLYVALCFACQNNKDNDNNIIENDGEVIIMKLPELKNDIDFNANTIYAINPAPNKTSQNRVKAQSSIFVHPPAGYISREEEIKLEIKQIIVESEFKQEILEELQSLHDIHIENLFNDMHGFIEYSKHIDSVNLHRALRDQTKGSLGSLNKSVKTYDKIIQTNPQSSKALIGRGIARLKQEKLPEAIQDLNRAITLNPRSVEAYVTRGESKSQLGENEDAEKDYDKAIGLDSTHSVSYLRRASLKKQLGRLEDAEKDYDKVIEIDPINANAYFCRASLRTQLGRLEDAEKDYDKVIEIDPKNTGAYFNRASLRTQLGRLEDAEKDYDKVIEIDPKNTGAYHNRSILRLDLNRLK